MDKHIKMDCSELDQINDYCEKALERFDQYGVKEGLSFLIGEKFYNVFLQLKAE